MIKLYVSGGVVQNELHGEIGATFTSLIPIGGQPLFMLQCTKNEIIAINEYDKRTALYCDLLNVQYVTVPAEGTLETAVHAAIMQAYDGKDPNEPLELIWGDTTINEELPLDVMGVVDVPDPTHWATIDGAAIAGVFTFSQPLAFAGALKNATLWQALEAYADVYPLRTHKLTTWHDYGRIDTLYKSRLKNMTARTFNSVTYDKSRDTVIKTSDTNPQKIRAEIAWYKALNNDLQSLAPALRDYDEETPKYEIEYIPTITAAEALLYGNHTTGYWECFFDGLNTYLDTLHKGADTQPDTQTRKDNNRKMYSERLQKRVQQLTATVPQVSKQIVLDGVMLPPLWKCMDTLLKWADNYTPAPTYRFIHGDLFLGNLFFDRRTGRIKAVDPRGTFGNLTTHGDALYDIAKLSHSLIGGYDSIAADLLSVTHADAHTRVCTAREQTTNPIWHLATPFIQKRAESLTATLEDVRMIEAGLFLSAAALHTESTDRQITLAATGIRILTEIEAI